MKTDSFTTLTQVARRAQRAPSLVARTIAALGIKPVAVQAGTRTQLALRAVDVERVLQLLARTTPIGSQAAVLVPQVDPSLNAMQ